MRIRTLPDISAWRDKTILLRLDLNVPIARGRIRDDFKLRAALPVIRKLRRHNRLIIISHRGEPVVTAKGIVTKGADLTLAPTVDWLKRQLGKNVSFCKAAWPDLKTAAAALGQGDVLVVENIRFFPGEITNSRALAAKLARLADVGVNDAFAVCHRAHASVAALQDFLPVYAGPLLSTEISQLDRVKKGRRPIVALLGGAKIKTKLPIIKALLRRSEAVLMGGALATTLLYARKQPIGKSLWDKDSREVAQRLTSKKILIPEDVVVSVGNKTAVREVGAVKATDIIIDIGPVTRALYEKHLRRAKTIIWNGPVGIFEKPAARAGTESVIRSIGRARAAGAFTLAGGGETVEAINDVRARKAFSWISTGGGASLAYLGAEPMPGLPVTRTR